MLERLPPPIFPSQKFSHILASSSLMLLVAGCALMGPSKPHDMLQETSQNRWEDDPTPRKRTRYKKRRVEKKPRTLKELAEGFDSADACFRRAKTNAQQNLEASWALAQACVQYQNFDNLEEFLSQPWTPVIQKKWPKVLALVTKISASTGGQVEFDVGLCNKFGLELVHFRETFTDIEGAKGELVMFRATALSSWVKSGKTRVLLRYEDREILAMTHIPPHRFRASSDYVVVGRLDGMRQGPKAPDNSLKISMIHAESVRVK